MNDDSRALVKYAQSIHFEARNLLKAGETDDGVYWSAVASKI